MKRNGNMKSKSVLVAALMALSLAIQPLHVAAEAVDDTAIERFDSRKFLDYAGCAIGIAFAAGTGAWLVAGLACYRAFAEHWTT